MANGYQRDLINPIIDFLDDNKPYHTKIVEVSTIYAVEDSISATITDSWTMHLRDEFNNVNQSYYMLCSGFGWNNDPFDTVPYSDPDSCGEFPSTIVYVTFNEEFTFIQGSEITLYENINTMFCNDTPSYSKQLQQYNIPGTIVTSAIIVADDTKEEFHIAGNMAWRFPIGISFEIVNSTSYDGDWTVDLAYYDNLTDVTVIRVQENILPGVTDGEILYSVVTIREHLEFVGIADNIYDWHGFDNCGYDVILPNTLNIYTDLLPSADYIGVTVEDHLTGALPEFFADNSAGDEVQATTFLETLEMSVTELILSDNLSTTFGETSEAVVDVGSAGSLVGSWDYTFWDIGGFDETLAVTIRNTY